MAQPPKLKRLLPEDYDFEADATEWGPKLLGVLTQFCGDVTNALTGQLTKGQNIRGEEWELEFSTGASVAVDASPFPLFLTPKVAINPRHLWVTFIENTSVAGGGETAGAAQPFWQLAADGKVKIRLIHGLDTNATYKLRGLME